MRKALCAVAFIMITPCGGAFAAQIAEIPFAPVSPAVMGGGGCAITTAQGFDAFFYNPAGLSRGGGGFTTSSTSWIYSRPDLLISQAAQLALGTANPTATFNFLSSQVTSGGFGAGSAIGIGYLSGGFGLGAAFIIDSMLYGQTMLGCTGDITATLGFMTGLSIPFDFVGIRVHVGGDVRPMIRIHALIPNSSAVTLVNAIANGGDIPAALSSTPAVYGSGVGFDLGFMGEVGWFSFGLSIRDLGGTTFSYSANSFGSVTGSLASQGSLPAGSSVSDTYTIPMDIGIGLSFHPDLGSFRHFVDPVLSLDLRNINGALDGSALFWTCVHAGAELKVFNLFMLRAGINQGYLTAGAGMKLFVFDLNVAVFTQELGQHLGDRPNACMTFNADLRI
ncbi:MAG: hypothetical protein ACLQCB_12515 [Spirochaetia bacterium]